MSARSVEYTKEAANDLKELDRTQQLQVLKAIKRVSENPLPNSEGGYGKPLGNHLSAKLPGYLKKSWQRPGFVLFTISNALKV
jgi:mRNA interferase RelE/StbE